MTPEERADDLLRRTAPWSAERLIVSIAAAIREAIIQDRAAWRKQVLPSAEEMVGDIFAALPDRYETLDAITLLADAMRKAVAEERETYARIAENAGKVGMGHAELAAAIRARSQP